MMRLIFHTGPRAGNEVNTSAQLIRLGRDPASNDVVVEDPQVSGRHCILTRSPRGTYVLEDLGSSNGTFVNEKAISAGGAHTAVYLASGDRFRLGGTEIEVGEGRPRLMIVGGKKAGRDVLIGDEPITIGRAPDNTLDFEDPDVSVYHGAILCLAIGFVLQDNGSTNGTFINGRKITRHILEDGDTINIGDNELRFLIDEEERAAGEDVARSQTTDSSALANLVFVAGPHQGMAVPLIDGQVTFGRRGDATFPVSDLQVSGFHCAITQIGLEHQVNDLRSTNGTFVNGNRLEQPVVLRTGDLVEFGQCVAEYRVTGGVMLGDDATSTVSTLMGESGRQVASQPKFIINGSVESASRISIGRSPSCHLRLDGDGVSAHHCDVVWEEAFYVEDKSRFGTYVGDKRIVKEKLQTGHVIRIGDQLIDVQVRGERCTLDVIDAAMAMAAIEIQRENEFKLKDAVVDEANSGGIDSAYKTVYKLEVADTEGLVQQRKAKFKKGAPAWRPSTDIKREAFGKIMVVSAIAAAVAVGVFLWTTERAEALINHPLSESHSTRLFVQQAEKLGMAGSCETCHAGQGQGVPDSKCAACHKGFQNSIRPLHAKPSKNKRPEQVSPGKFCVDCHGEHKGHKRFNKSGAPSLLGAGGRCNQAQCHPSQHTEDFLRQGPKPPVVHEAGPVPTFDLAQREFHAAHAQVEHKGKTISIGCTSCHSRKDDKTGELIEASSGKSCFQCHSGGEQHTKSQCSSCHDDEHQGNLHLERLPKGDPMAGIAVPTPSPVTSLLKGGALALAAFLPLIGIALLRRMRRGKRAEEVVQELQQIPTEVVKRIIHSINIEKCVGCHMCVQACPASVLELVNHKSTIVNFDACIQCRKCEQACAFDALRMHEADKPPPMVQMPEVDYHYQTRVEGMYLIGQASGTPQVKNASNLGRAVVQHAVKLGGLKPGAGRAVGAQYDVIVVGSGPAGLSAALSCAQLGLNYVLLEKQRNFSWTIRNYYHKGKPVMAEPHHVEMVGLLPHWDTNREELLAAWEQAMQQYQVKIEYLQNVTDVKKDGQMFNVICTDKEGKVTATWTAARVVLGIGTMGQPRTLGCPGDDLEKVAPALVDPDEFKGKNIIVVGGTDSAIEVVMALCNTNKVWMSCRGAKFDRVKPKNLKLIEETFAAGKATPLFATVIKEVTATTVTVEYKEDKRTETIPNDFVFAMVGGHPPIKWLQSVGVEYTEKPHSWSPPRTDDLCKETM